MTKTCTPARPGLALLAASFLSSAIGAADLSLTEFKIMEMPATCRLLPTELRKREATLLAELRKQVVTAHALTDGYALLLKADEPAFKLATEVIAVESKCCPFLQFRLTVAQESRALLLEMRGPTGSRELLAQVLQIGEAAP